MFEFRDLIIPGYNERYEESAGENYLEHMQYKQNNENFEFIFDN